jgi:hypothetical protein
MGFIETGFLWIGTLDDIQRQTSSWVHIYKCLIDWGPPVTVSDEMIEEIRANFAKLSNSQRNDLLSKPIHPIALNHH